MNIEDIQRLTKAYADAHNGLAERVETLNADLEALKRRRLHGIRAAVRNAAEAREQLRVAIEANTDIFSRPRTHVIHGVRVGLQKAKGELRYESAEQVVRLIRRHLPDEADVLIKTTETPVKRALAQLPAASLRRIGVELIDSGDQVLIKPTDSEVDKIVSALLRDAEPGDGVEEVA